MDQNQADMIDKVDDLIESLSCQLEKQISMAVQGDWGGVESLMSDAENLIQKIAQLKVIDSPALMEKKNKLQNMYKKLSLIIAGNKDETFAELTKVRKNKTVVGVYKKGAC